MGLRRICIPEMEVRLFHSPPKYNLRRISMYHKRTKNTTKLTIAGFAPSWKNANFKDPEMEFWIINSLYTFFEQVRGFHFERLYDLHRSQYIIQQDDDGSHTKKLKELVHRGVQVVTCEPLEFLPQAMVYPVDEIEKMVGISYFTNTITYLILHACYEKMMGYWDNLKEIHVIGVDMAQDGMC
jgi:hypothetical protein